MSKPRNDGKRLQDWVEVVESKLHSVGFTVETNVVEFDLDGNLAGEFDIRFTGTNQNTGVVWLIECRDRKSHGPAPGAWIEQLYGRRERFKFTKVTAVSSSGFALNAIKYAREVGIELKEMKDMTAADFSQWLHIDKIDVSQNSVQLTGVLFTFNCEMTPAIDAAIKERTAILFQPGCAVVPLIKRNGGEMLTLGGLLVWYVEQYKVGAHLIPDGPIEPIEVTLDTIGNGDIYEIETAVGSLQLTSLHLKGDLCLKTSTLPLIFTQEYRDTATGKMIAEVASFEPHEVNGMMITQELHRIPETGLTHVVMRSEPVKKPKA